MELFQVSRVVHVLIVLEVVSGIQFSLVRARMKLLVEQTGTTVSRDTGGKLHLGDKRPKGLLSVLASTFTMQYSNAR